MLVACLLGHPPRAFTTIRLKNRAFLRAAGFGHFHTYQLYSEFKYQGFPLALRGRKKIRKKYLTTPQTYIYIVFFRLIVTHHSERKYSLCYSYCTSYICTVGVVGHFLLRLPISFSTLYSDVFFLFQGALPSFRENSSAKKSAYVCPCHAIACVDVTVLHLRSHDIHEMFSFASSDR